MTQFARIESGVVMELFSPPTGLGIADCFHGGLVWAGVDGVSPAPEVGWEASQTGGVWHFAAPAAPVLTLAEQAVARLAEGLSIASTGTPALSAVYPADAAAQQKLLSIQTVLAGTGSFPGGAATWPLKDRSGAWHVVNVAQFTAIATAIAAFVAPIDLILDGRAGVALPAASASIQ